MKKILISGLLLLVACTKVDLPAPVQPQANADIFSVKQSEVVDGQTIKFNLKSDGIYTLTIGDSTSSQVITRERFTGKVGENTLTLYTKSLPTGFLYLLLEDQNKSTVGKTTIITK